MPQTTVGTPAVLINRLFVHAALAICPGDAQGSRPTCRYTHHAFRTCAAEHGREQPPSPGVGIERLDCPRKHEQPDACRSARLSPPRADDRTRLHHSPELENGLIHLARYAAALLCNDPAPRPQATSGSPLSNRETELLGLIRNGYTVKDIARTIGRSASTVSSHLSNIYRKLGVPDKTQAVLTAERRGLI